MGLIPWTQDPAHVRHLTPLLSPQQVLCQAGQTESGSEVRLSSGPGHRVKASKQVGSGGKPPVGMAA